ncbi:hypothetical protein OGAPHI_001753 [Ogataea philodendri]|uniref:Uncharacterized protein n=1 Tax=Ogataea philodendri TaxID=1378263 RepID=A0A9P8T714_9ASCO|nr:uncharacterized protein OGAPHI_001753 [Ogataea philodendri]KAH3667999.1 hypothetical protein OGAPHI_001753 [Ogataea philodendri]
MATLLSLLGPRQPRKCNIASVDQSVEFVSGKLYDIASVPGTTFQWDILFGLLQHESRSAVINVHSHIPWDNFQGNKANVDIYTVGSLTQLIALVQSLDFSQYKLVVLNDFHVLYQSAVRHLEDKRRGETPHRYKRDANGARKDQPGPTRKLQLVVQDLLLLISSKCQTHETIGITTGKMTTMSQRFFTRSQNSDIDDETEDTSMFQQIMVPVLPLNGPWAGQYAKRLVLYRDWVRESGGTGLDKNLTIVDYIRLMETKQLRVCPQFLGVTSKDSNRKFDTGWWCSDAQLTPVS